MLIRRYTIKPYTMMLVIGLAVPTAFADQNNGDPVGACCFANSDCQVISSSSCSTLGGTFLGADIECPPPGTTRYKLGNHPAGGGAPPLYGLRLDGLLHVPTFDDDDDDGDDDDDDDGGSFNSKIVTFDFEDEPGTCMFLDLNLDAGTIRIFGRAFGGVVKNNDYVNPEFWDIDFTYVEGVGLVGGDGGFPDVHANNCPASGANSGTIAAVDGSPGPIALVDYCGSNSFAFRFGDVNGAGHRGFDGLSGWGWLNHSGRPHLWISDWLFTAELVCPEPPPSGACCFSDGTCNVISELSCNILGGNFLGNGTECANCPPPTGACCMGDGSCNVISEASCNTLGGNYLGNNTACANCPPLTGACCFADGSCNVISESSCGTLGGNFLGNNTDCANCPTPTGACCNSNDGTCVVTTQANCSGANLTYQGNGTKCTPNPCPPPTGACCFNDNTCTQVSRMECENAGGNFLGTNTPCSACPQIGACCFNDNTCTQVSQNDCNNAGGNFLGTSTPCSACPQIGACCFNDNTCTQVS
ncbi:MAG: hypothetical protein MI923_00910, partial [Phycisphaerales bacterium]|nr:hypothetical protein [Phycisphaerales bacterium]